MLDPYYKKQEEMLEDRIRDRPHYRRIPSLLRKAAQTKNPTESANNGEGVPSDKPLLRVALQLGLTQEHSNIDNNSYTKSFLCL